MDLRSACQRLTHLRTEVGRTIGRCGGSLINQSHRERNLGHFLPEQTKNPLNSRLHSDGAAAALKIA